MEKLELSLDLLNKTLKTLKDGFATLEEAKAIKSESLILAAQDSLIQRFEYTFESFWKFLKQYLEIIFNIEDVNSPKKVFRTCVKFKLCSESEGEILINMADDRNETTHVYSIEKVRIILTDIPIYYDNMRAILKKLNYKQ